MTGEAASRMSPLSLLLLTKYWELIDYVLKLQKSVISLSKSHDEQTWMKANWVGWVSVC